MAIEKPNEQSTNTDQKLIETVFLIAICHQWAANGNWKHCFYCFLPMFFYSISVFDCRQPGVILCVLNFWNGIFQFIIWPLTFLGQLMSSADNLCKQFGPRSDVTKSQARSGSNSLTFWCQKYFFENVCFEKKSADHKTGMQNSPTCSHARVNVLFGQKWVFLGHGPYRWSYMSDHFIWNLLNEPLVSLKNLIWNDHGCKILFIIYPSKYYFIPF